MKRLEKQHGRSINSTHILLILTTCDFADPTSKKTPHQGQDPLLVPFYPTKASLRIAPRAYVTHA